MTYSNIEKQREFQRKWQATQRIKRRNKVIELLGGCCSICGYKENYLALEIDHIIPVRRKNNEPHITGNRLWTRILLGKEDMTNIRLLCSNCHSIETYKQLYSK